MSETITKYIIEVKLNSVDNLKLDSIEASITFLTKETAQVFKQLMENVFYMPEDIKKTVRTMLRFPIEFKWEQYDKVEVKFYRLSIIKEEIEE